MPQAQPGDDDRLALPELLAIIEDLYRQLQALPYTERPCTRRTRGHPSPEYVRLEAAIHGYAQQVWAWTDPR